MTHMREASTKLYKENIIGIAAISNMNDDFLQARLAFRGIYMRDNFVAKEKDVELAKAALDKTFKDMDIYEKTITEQEDRDMFEEFKESFTNYSKLHGDMVEGIKAKKNNSELMQITGQYVPVGDTLTALLGKMAKYNLEQGKTTSEGNEISAEKNDNNNDSFIGFEHISIYPIRNHNSFRN